MATAAEVFALALQYHQAGNLLLAEQGYRQVLQIVPTHSDALNGLGVVLAQQDNPVEAIFCFQSALRLLPGDVNLHHNLGLLNSRQGNHEAAISQYQQVLRLKPDHVEAFFNLANSLRKLGKLNEANASYQEALRLNPNHVQTLNNFGALLMEQGRLPEAVECFKAALRLMPHLAEACNNLGNALFRLERFEEAIAYYRQAIQIKPGFAEGWYNLGNALKRQCRLDEAIRCFQEALRLRPNYAEACNNLGSTLTLLDKLEEAVVWYRAALRINPHYAAAYYNWGNALARQDKADEAIDCYRQALRFNPTDAAAQTNLGNLLGQQGHLEEALACFDQALQHDSGRAETHFNRALLRLLKGDWPQAWPEYEWRLQTTDFPRCPFPQPRWDGSALAGRRLLVLAEQGLGDTFLFVRYVSLLRQQGHHVIFQCQPPLMPIMTACLGPKDLFAQGATLPTFDVYTPLLSLPGILGTTPTNVPGIVPYLHAKPELVERWKHELQAMHIQADTSRLRIGIAWQGTPTFRGDRQRSFPLAHFGRLVQIPKVQLISLQKGPGVDQLARFNGQFPVVDLGSRLDETNGAFMDTAAVMMNLDLVITSDTAVSHLAGALGRPVWLALALVPDWRWLLDRHDSPWYPTMRLFRQERYGQWDDVFDRMATEIQALFAKGPNMT